MQIERPLFWAQGTLLQPQHFQLLERIGQGMLSPYHEYGAPYFWGVGSMALQKSALGARCFELKAGEFLFPDGTFVSLHENGCIAPRVFDEAWIKGDKPFTVLLGLRKWCDTGENVSVVPTQASAGNVSTRFVTSSDPEDTKDLHAGGPEAQVKRLRYVLQILWETEEDQLGEYEWIPLAQLERSGSEIRLSDTFIPPCLCCSASPLQNLLREIRDQLAARCRQLEEHKSKRGVYHAEFGSRDMVYFLALRSFNRYLPLLFHYSDAHHYHPWHMYGILRQLVGELSTFSEQINVTGASLESKKDIPKYDHQDLWSCFSAVQAAITRLLDEITAGPEYIVALNFDGTFFSADIKPAIFEGRNRFYLAINTEEDTKNVLKAQEEVIKLSAPGHLELLVSRSLPGIGLQYLQIPPQELPRRAGTFYFAVNHFDDQWAIVVKERCLALYWNGAPADVEIELQVVGR